MKYYSHCILIFFIAFVLSLIPFSLKAQQEERIKDSLYHKPLGREQPIKTIIKTSILAPFYWQLPYTGEYRVVGEFMIAPKQSVQLGASYLTRSIFVALIQKMPSNNGSAKVGINGYRIQAAYKYYLINKKFRPEGLYLSIHSSFASEKVNAKDYPGDYQLLQHFNLNLLVGGQVIIGNRVSLELFMGPGYKNNSYLNRARPGYGPIDLDKLMPLYHLHLKFSLGMNVGVVL